MPRRRGEDITSLADYKSSVDLEGSAALYFARQLTAQTNTHTRAHTCSYVPMSKSQSLSLYLSVSVSHSSVHLYSIYIYKQQPLVYVFTDLNDGFCYRLLTTHISSIYIHSVDDDVAAAAPSPRTDFVDKQCHVCTLYIRKLDDIQRESIHHSRPLRIGEFVFT